MKTPGIIYLVGAGPGDPGLLTLKGRQCLARADVVVYDYLANPRLLDYAPAHAECVLVGKHGGGTRVEQEDINRILITHAQHGKIVVRLKGGDPFIYGRGAEEADVARQAGIPFEVVPGISSAIAVPAYAGIPLTHRTLASNVIFTTGYEAAKDQPAVRWRELARSGSTLVLLMTTRQLRHNMTQLLDGGLAPDTPAALVRWGTRAAQHTVEGTVATLADRADAAGITPPAIAVVGQVVSLRTTLNWFEHKPLFGRRIVITRPRHQAADFAERLEALGAEVIPFPTIEIIPPPSWQALDDAIQRAAEFDWVILTSANGVHMFFDRLRDTASDIRHWHRARFAAIGPKTAEAITAYGVQVTLLPGDYRAEGLLDAFTTLDIAQQRVLLPRAAGARAVLPQQLTALGAIVEEIHTYRTQPPTQRTDELAAMIAQQQTDCITFTSSSTVHNFIKAFGAEIVAQLSGIHIGCIGPITADTARSYGMTVAIQPAAYTIPDFADAIRHYFTRNTSPIRHG